MTEGWTGI